MGVVFNMFLLNIIFNFRFFILWFVKIDYNFEVFFYCLRFFYIERKLYCLLELLNMLMWVYVIILEEEFDLF